MLWNIELKFCIRTSWFNCTTDQVLVSFICVTFCWSYSTPFWTVLKIQFSIFFSYMLLHIELTYCIWLSLKKKLQIIVESHQFTSILVVVMNFVEFKILEIQRNFVWQYWWGYKDTDKGSIPEMRILSILLNIYDLKWRLHLSRHLP